MPTGRVSSRRFRYRAPALALSVAVATVLTTLAPAPNAEATVAEVARSVSGVVSLPEGMPTEWLAAVQVSASSGSSYESAAVDPVTGAYTIADVEPGSYRVQFSVNQFWDGTKYVRPNLVGEYFDDATNYSDATPVDVSMSSAANIDADLALGRTISGKVSIPDGMDPLSLGAVSVSASGNVGWGGNASVDPATGEYTLAGLAPGHYRVQFSVSSYWNGTSSVSPNLVSEYYDNATDWSTATPVDVSSADQSGIDAALEPGRSISGTVSIPDDAPSGWLSAVSVSASAPSGSLIGSRYANVDPDTGDYTITGLAPGAYTVAYRVSQGMPGTETPNLADEFYDNAYTQSEAESVDVSTGDRADIDATLEYGTTISGTVTLPADAPAEWLQTVHVSAMDSGSGYNTAVDAQTGDYTLTRLAPGEHRVYFSAGEGLAPEYYDDAPTLATATPVSTTDGNATGIDAELEHGANFSGTVDVSAVEFGEETGIGITVTDLTGTIIYNSYGDPFPSDGQYNVHIGTVRPGSYRVAVSTLTWDEATGRSTPVSTQFLRFGSNASITLDAGENVTDLQLTARATDASLAGNIHAQGFADDTSGSILGSALVYERIDNQWVRLPDSRTDTTTGDTPYALAVPAGTYTVGYENDYATVSGDIREEWWNTKPTLAIANSVTLSSGQTKSNINGSIRVVNATPSSVTRLSGSWRVETAVEISKATFPTPGVPVVYIANAYNFPDALAGAPAAAIQGGPILLTTIDTLPETVANELSRLKPERIVVLGGPPAVSETVETQLNAYTDGG